MRIFRLPAIGLLFAALAVPVAANSATASATSPIQTAIIDFTATPSAISVGNTQVTLSGKLVEAADHSVGLPNETLFWAFMMADDGSPTIGSGSTGSDGSFAIPYTTDVGGMFDVQFSGDSAHNYAGAPVVHINVKAVPDPTSVTINAQPESLVSAGSALTFTGKAEAMSADGMQPLANVFVGMLRNGLPTGAGAFTKADGTFTATLTAYSGGAWQAEVDALGWPQAYLIYQQSKSNSVQVNVQYNTRVEAFSVPAKHEAHATFTVSGHVQALSGTAYWFGASGLSVGFYYRVPPAAGWVRAGSATTAANGAFRGSARVVPGHSVWQVRVAKQSLGDVYLPSASGTSASFITDRTCASISVRHSHGRTTVSGAVKDRCAAKERSFGAVKGVVKVYYHPRGAKTWRYFGQVHTGAGGTYSDSLHGVLNGDFRVVFPAQGYFLGSVSKTLRLG